MQVYDSAYDSLDKETEAIVLNLFRGSSLPIQMAKLQKQVGGSDCGPFAIAVATSLAHQRDPSALMFEQTVMRAHLVQCFEKGKLTPFPCK